MPHASAGNRGPRRLDPAFATAISGAGGSQVPVLTGHLPILGAVTAVTPASRGANAASWGIHKTRRRRG